MFSFFTTNQDNVITTTQKLLEGLHVPVTDTTLNRSLKEHPDYPSLLSVSDALSQWGVKSMGLYAKMAQLPVLPTPFIAHIREAENDQFTVVKEIRGNTITYCQSDHQPISIPLDAFSDKYRGTVLLAEPNEDAGEPEYRQKHRQEVLKRLRLPVVLIIAVLLIGVTAANTILSGGTHILFLTAFTLLSLAGMVVTGLLLWYEIDHQNPVLHKICTSGRHTNCGAVLQSKAARLGGLIGWSEVGFIYFSGGFLSLLLSGMHPSIMATLAWLNVLAVPYVFFSVYYQWRIAREWCVLCLTVQGLLVAELLVCLTGSLYATPLTAMSPQWIVLLVFSFLAPGLVWSVLKPVWLRAEEGKRNKAALLRLKHDPRIFNALLPKQKGISAGEISSLGITLGSSTAKYQLIKVCNPYCGPCARAHPKIEELIENNPDISARIIFTATAEEKDKRSWPVKHLMAINEKGDKALTKQALDDWYNAEKKDYKVFADKYPLNGELQQQGEKLKAMSAWCENIGISFTPTFFVIALSPVGEEADLPAKALAQAGVGHQLPDIYGVEDIKYLLA